MKKTIQFIAVIIVIGGAIWFVTRTPAASSALDSFAQCLRDKGATMYGASWCPHCQNEKKAFGSSFRFVNYVECPKDPKKCLDAGVEGYPTWIFPDERRFEGEMGLQKLSLESGCVLNGAPTATNAPRPGELKTDTGQGEVIVSASFKEENGQFLFVVSLDAHTITLDDFNPIEQIKLAVGDGQTFSPQKLSEQGSEHHREFVLAFPKAAGVLKLLIANLAGTPQRELVWTE